MTPLFTIYEIPLATHLVQIGRSWTHGHEPFGTIVVLDTQSREKLVEVGVTPKQAQAIGMALRDVRNS